MPILQRIQFIMTRKVWQIKATQIREAKEEEVRKQGWEDGPVGEVSTV